MTDTTSSYIQGSIIGAIIGLAVGISIGLAIADHNAAKAPATTADTIRITEPRPALPDTIIRHQTARLPTAPAQRWAPPSREPAAPDTAKLPAVEGEAADSATVLIPITRRTYTDTTTYRAVVEGYDPRLVTLDIYPRPAPPAKRFHLGPSVGLGWDGHGIKPFIGLTLTYSLWSF